jgi:hypothetical protein
MNFLTKASNAVIRRKYFPPGWKHAHFVFILQPGKEPKLPSSYRPISLLHTVDKHLEKILLTRVIRKINKGGFRRKEQFSFRPTQSNWPALLKESTDTLTGGG